MLSSALRGASAPSGASLHVSPAPSPSTSAHFSHAAFFLLLLALLLPVRRGTLLLSLSWSPSSARIVCCVVAPQPSRTVARLSGWPLSDLDQRGLRRLRHGIGSAGEWWEDGLGGGGWGGAGIVRGGGRLGCWVGRWWAGRMLGATVQQDSWPQLLPSCWGPLSLFISSPVWAAG